MGGTPSPLLVVCALRIERFALRRGVARSAADAVTVLRTGMGPKAADRAVRAALHDPSAADTAVLTTGFCAGLAPGMRPGDVVVPDDGHESAALVAALKAAGHTVHTGTLAESDHVVRGAERTALAATGAIAVDMESASMRRAALAEGAHRIAAPASSSTRPSSNSCVSERFAPGSSHSGCSEILFPPFSNGTALPRSPGGELRWLCRSVRPSVSRRTSSNRKWSGAAKSSR